MHFPWALHPFVYLFVCILSLLCLSFLFLRPTNIGLPHGRRRTHFLPIAFSRPPSPSSDSLYFSSSFLSFFFLSFPPSPPPKYPSLEAALERITEAAMDSVCLRTQADTSLSPEDSLVTSWGQEEESATWIVVTSTQDCNLQTRSSPNISLRPSFMHEVPPSLPKLLPRFSLGQS